MRVEQAEPDTPELFPGVETAFEFIIPSYQLVEQRLQAADSRLQTLQTYAATLTVAATIIASSVVKNIDFTSFWFVLAIGTFLLIVAGGATAQVHGVIRVISPNKLFDDWLWREPWRFKKDLLAFAGEDFDKNVALVNLKGRAALFLAGLFLVEALLLVAWVWTEN